jgi:D-glycero-D-manno-heptose 1,7-bisphosphate phosphatase
VPTLFLDRDGVLNDRIPGDYVTAPEALVVLPGVPESIVALAAYFECIVVVTNQAGIGKGRMTEADLHRVHNRLQQAVEQAGGRIDRFYYCPHRSDAGCTCRKPEPGMALQAQADFPNLNFADCWMVGDSASDIQFGQRLGMQTALIEGKAEENTLLATLQPTLRCRSLTEFVEKYKAQCV